MGVYSFLQVSLSIEGPGLSLTIGGAGGVAKEGFTVTMAEDANLMTIGADGGIMHSMRASTASRLSLRLLKTNPLNAILSSGYNYQHGSGGSYWGQNVFAANNPSRGDIFSGVQGAFVRQPDWVNAEDGNVVSWDFDIGASQEVIGDGTPVVSTV